MIEISASRLPADPEARMRALEAYFAHDRLPVWTQDGERILVELVSPPTPQFYVDPLIEDGLEWWGSGAAIEDVPNLYRRQNGLTVAMNDAWCLYSWSRWYSALSLERRSQQVCVLHIDDHEDLMTPRVLIGEGGLEDQLTGKPVGLDDPDSVRASILSGAIGMGSFVAPAVATFSAVKFRHLRTDGPEMGPLPMQVVAEPDTLLLPGAQRLGIDRTSSGTSGSSYMRTSDPQRWAEVLDDVAVLLHIDLDYFNNRFDGDSDWKTRSRVHDPDLDVMLRNVDAIVDALNRNDVMHRIEDVFIGISPGFFPAEFWQVIIERLESGLAGATSGAA